MMDPSFIFRTFPIISTYFVIINWLFFSFVEESIDNTLRITEDVFNTGDHSVSNIDKQIIHLKKHMG